MYKVSKDSLSRALDMVNARGDTDFFPRPYEFEAIRAHPDKVMDFLTAQDTRGWQTRASRSALAPKGRFSFRPVVQFDPLDHLLFTGLVIEAASDIEAHRIPVADQVVYSSRYDSATADRMFTGKISWASFIEQCRSNATEMSCTHVVVADIADFYPRLYHHRIENSLGAAIANPELSKAIAGLISNWSPRNQSYGLPIGTDASRLVAELAIDDVDRLLRSNRIKFCRWVDDYRLFCKSKKDAYRSLFILAESLHKSHGLSLQPNKTRILDSETFLANYGETEEQRELGTLAKRFEAVVEALELEDPYQVFSPDDLDDETKEMLSNLNLVEALRASLGEGEDGVRMADWCLRRLAQTGADAFQVLESEAGAWYPLVVPIARYLTVRAERASLKWRRRAISLLLKQLDESEVGVLDFHRAWLIRAIGALKASSLKDSVIGSVGEISSGLARREAMLAIGALGGDYWVRPKLDDWPNLDPWMRRAAIVAAGCLPQDERAHWFRVAGKSIDLLEQVCVQWARAPA